MVYSAVTLLGIGLNNKGKFRMNMRLNIFMCAFVCLLLSIGGRASAKDVQPKGSITQEVFVLSVEYFSPIHAKIVVRPCDKFVNCPVILIRANENTVWVDQDERIAYSVAKKLDWSNAILVRDRNNYAVMIKRVHEAVYKRPEEFK